MSTLIRLNETIKYNVWFIVGVMEVKIKGKLKEKNSDGENLNSVEDLILLFVRGFI